MTETHPLSTQDVQNFIYPDNLYPPNGEADGFALMAGSIIPQYELFAAMPPEIQEQIFLRLLAFAHCGHAQYDKIWDKNQGPRGSVWNTVRSTIHTQMENEEFGNTKEVIELMTPYTDATHSTINGLFTRAEVAICNMFVKKVYTLEEVNGKKRPLKNYSDVDEGRQYRSYELPIGNHRTSLRTEEGTSDFYYPTNS